VILPDVPLFYGCFKTEWITEWIVWNTGRDAAAFSASLPVHPSSPVLRGAGMAVARAFSTLRPLMDVESRAGALRRAAIVLNMLSDLSAGEEASPGRQSQGDTVAEVVEYIQRHYGAPLSVADLADRAGMSTAAFRRAFRERTGQTPKKHICAVRLARAKEMLEAGRAIKDVADACGYSDVFHFMNVFRRETGMTARTFVRSVHSDGGSGLTV
jgi:AraC-like DNA-binding protein